MGMVIIEREIAIPSNNDEQFFAFGKSFCISDLHSFKHIIFGVESSG